MGWEEPERRQGRTAVVVLVAAIFVATALAIALVVGAASRSSGSSGDVLVLGERVTHDTSRSAPRNTSHTSTTTGGRVDASGSTAASSPSAAPTATAAPPDVPLELPVPGPPPGDEYPDVPVEQTATISAPTIELDAAVYEGVSLTVLDVGPGHWPGTAAAGGYGNVVIAGHRTTWTHPFERIGELAPGDPIVVTDGTGSYTYAVEGSEVVTPDRVDIVAQAPGRTLTLFACHPPGSEQYRYVVRARLVSPPRAPGL